MPPPPRSGGALGSDDYTVFSLILIVVGLSILGWALWQLYHAEISAGAMQAAHWQMQLIHRFTDRFEIADAQVMRANPNHVTFDRLVRLYRNIGLFFLYPAMALVLALAALCFRRAGSARFTRRFDLEGLMAEQATIFRATAAFVGRRLKLSGVRRGEPRPADPALRPSEWIAAWASGEDGAFDEAAARRELARQLGQPWRGCASAAPHVRCMLAAIALHGAQKRNEAIDCLGLLSESLPRDRRDGPAGPERALAFSAEAVGIADRVLAEVAIAGPALDAMGRHFFTTPGLMSALCEARLRGGVLAPAQFAFLKLVDRRLWYALHSLGFEVDGPRAPHPSQRIEAIGARDHWAAERLARRPLAAPEIDRAVEAVRASQRL